MYKILHDTEIDAKQARVTKQFLLLFKQLFKSYRHPFPLSPGFTQILPKSAEQKLRLPTSKPFQLTLANLAFSGKINLLAIKYSQYHGRK